FFFSSRRRHTRFSRDWSSDVCSSDLTQAGDARELKSGGNVVVTADVPKVARVAGLGVVTLAKYSQCPIVPLAMATTHVHRLSNRSEERRVGKECRSRVTAGELQKR